MATSCDDDTDGGKSFAILEVSNNDVANWEQVPQCYILSANVTLCHRQYHCVKFLETLLA